jgi:hypothetical protein
MRGYIFALLNIDDYTFRLKIIFGFKIFYIRLYLYFFRKINFTYTMLLIRRMKNIELQHAKYLQEWKDIQRDLNENYKE